MQLKKGFLVAFEGIDGAGKTTQAHLLHKKLKRKEYDVILSKEPTDSIYGLRIKKLAQSERAITKPIDEYELFLNDRKIHVKDKIKPSLEQKKIVILDRYYFSTIAYQGALGLNPKKIKDDNESFAPIPEIVSSSLGPMRTPHLPEKASVIVFVVIIFILVVGNELPDETRIEFTFPERGIIHDLQVEGNGRLDR